MILHLRAAVAQLYAVPPSRFTPLRAELVASARTAGDKELAAAVGALRKPTVAAWAVNHLVRSQPDSLADFLAFADLLREAQRSLDSEQLRTLGRERSRRVDELLALVLSAAAAAGTSVGAGATDEVRQTLTAVIADEEAQATVLTGSLVKALSYSGFGSVDIADVVALGDGDDEDDGDDGDDGERRRAPRLSLLRGGRGADAEATSDDTDDTDDTDGSSESERPGATPASEAAGPGTGPDTETDTETDSAARTERRRARRALARERLVTHLEQAGGALRSSARRVEVLGTRRQEVVDGIADLERRLVTARARLAAVTAELAEASGRHEDLEDAEAAARAAVEAHDERSGADDHARPGPGR